MEKWFSYILHRLTVGSFAAVALSETLSAVYCQKTASQQQKKQKNNETDQEQ